MQTEKNKATTKAKKPSIHERLEINKRKNTKKSREKMSWREELIGM